jgi:hypothetical protein
MIKVYGFQITIGLLGCAFLWLGWTMHANSVTLQERFQWVQVKWLPRNEKLRDAMEEEYAFVTYNDHFWYVATFQNPWPHYGPATEQAFKR